MKNKVESIGGLKKLLHLDGWKNILTGQGVVGRDKQLSNEFGTPAIIDYVTAENMYRADGFSRRVINLPTAEMIRQWFEVQGDTENKIPEFISNDLSGKKIFRQALRWSEIFGGAGILMGIDDGGLLVDPLKEESIKEVEFLRPYDRYRITWTSGNLYDDPSEKKYNTPKIYDISPISGNPYQVHESRILIFDGEPVTDRVRYEQQGWSDSVYQAIFNQLSNLNGVYYSAKNIIDDFIQVILKLDNLAELVASGQEQVIKDRLNILDLSRHTINAMLLDKEEDYSKFASSIAGLDKVIDKFILAVTAVTGIPASLFMGQAPQGMNATGDSDVRIWYDAVQDKQANDLLPPLQRLVDLILKSKNNPIGSIPENWSVKFIPLWQPTLKETTETREVQSKADKVYLDTGVVLPEEIAESRFGGESYSHETKIDTEARKIPKPEKK